MQIPLVADAKDLDYVNAQSLTLPRDITALQAWNIAMQSPIPGMATAMWLRDRISGWFNVAPIKGFSGALRGAVQVGDKIDFFTVEAVGEGLLVLTARDRHLDVMTTVTTYDRVLTITSSVITHNWFGRAYMLPVGVAHKGIVWWTLRKVAAHLA
ncbi:DUF2867 domain-containing protein [Pseudorhodobacter sp. W20_MBD10_FR17]|uniref:DUF2867 domain-containing protein n=1 Tax=Pseudorhodobacter sp. W20_MBD10_FR17 TaxID=3240266 RepID=UPI003F966542